MDVELVREKTSHTVTGSTESGKDLLDDLFHPAEEGPQPILLDPAIICGSRSLKLQHGYLCPRHYRAQSQALPKAEAKPQPPYQDAIQPGMVDCALIAEKEAAKIAAAHKEGKVRRVRFGALEPDYIHYVPHVFDEDYVW